MQRLQEVQIPKQPNTLKKQVASRESPGINRTLFNEFSWLFFGAEVVIGASTNYFRLVRAEQIMQDEYEEEKERENSSEREKEKFS